MTFGRHKKYHYYYQIEINGPTWNDYLGRFQILHVICNVFVSRTLLFNPTATISHVHWIERTGTDRPVGFLLFLLHFWMQYHLTLRRTFSSPVFARYWLATITLLTGRYSAKLYSVGLWYCLAPETLPPPRRWGASFVRVVGVRTILCHT